jgi:hypothetical protein
MLVKLGETGGVLSCCVLRLGEMLNIEYRMLNFEYQSEIQELKMKNVK